MGTEMSIVEQDETRLADRDGVADKNWGGRDPEITAESRAGRVWSTPHGVAFWVVAAAFLLNMAFSAVPTPLYVLYQARDHFSAIMVTVVYAVYAVGVIASLFLAGHISDWAGRRRVLVTALLVNVASAMLFIFFPSLAGLIVARVVSGISVGLTTATATAYLAELHTGARPDALGRRPQVVATAANLGGIGIGPLVAGVLAQYAPAPLRLPYIVVGGAIAALALLVALAPETTVAPEVRPAWRPQRVAVPKHARSHFFAATSAGIAAFAVYGVFEFASAELFGRDVTRGLPRHSGRGGLLGLRIRSVGADCLGKVDQRAVAPMQLAGLALRSRVLRDGDVARQSDRIRRRRDRDRGRGWSGLRRCACRGREHRPGRIPGRGPGWILPRGLHRTLGAGHWARDRHHLHPGSRGHACVRRTGGQCDRRFSSCGHPARTRSAAVVK